MIRGCRRLLKLPIIVGILIGLNACTPSDQHRQNIVWGSFGGGKLIALNEWTGGNSVGSNLEAFADVSDQSTGVLDVRGPQHWRCTGVFRTRAQSSSSGSLFESGDDRTKDRILSLPSLVLTGEIASGVGFVGPAGFYLVTIELPAASAKFSHSWRLGDGGYSPMTMLYDNNRACLQVADTAVQQRLLGDQYLAALERLLSRLNPSDARTQLQALLDQARQSKLSGDSRSDPGQRTADYQTAVTTLQKLMQSVQSSANPALRPADVSNLTKIANNAAAILSDTGLA